jgi:hypothetical protein
LLHGYPGKDSPVENFGTGSSFGTAAGTGLNRVWGLNHGFR